MSKRNNPIPGSLEPVPGYPSVLKLYRIPASKNFQIRVHMNGSRLSRTSGTEMKSKAQQAAKDYYNELLLKRAQGEPLVESGQVKKVFDDLIATDQARVNRDGRGKKKQSLVNDSQYIFKKDLFPFFKSDQLKNITFKRINEYVAHIEKRGISAKTVKNHLIVLSKILKHAHKLDQLDKMPSFPVIPTQDNPREWFTEEQYEQLKEAIAKEVKDKTVVNRHPITNELLCLSVFMVNSFLRPSDIKLLQNKHVTVVKKPHTYLRIEAKGKTKQAPVVTMPLAVDIFEQLTAMNAKLGFGKPDDFVFFPGLSRSYAQQTMQRQFKHVLVKYGLKTGIDGAPRTLYSLRHTAIMLRYKKGDLDIFLLARNCRTSVDMIERFYGSHLEPEMNVEQLQSYKKGYVGQPMHKSLIKQ